VKVIIIRNPARSLGCELQEGETGEIDDDIGKVLVARGIANCLDEPEPEPKPGTVEKATADLEAYRVQAVPEQPAIAESAEPAIAPKKTAKAERKTTKPKNKGA
jgi:hypothetical protein